MQWDILLAIWTLNDYLLSHNLFDFLFVIIKDSAYRYINYFLLHFQNFRIMQDLWADADTFVRWKGIQEMWSLSSYFFFFPLLYTYSRILVKFLQICLPASQTIKLFSPVKLSYFISFLRAWTSAFFPCTILQQQHDRLTKQFAYQGLFQSYLLDEYWSKRTTEIKQNTISDIKHIISGKNKPPFSASKASKIGYAISRTRNTRVSKVVADHDDLLTIWRRIHTYI